MPDNVPTRSRLPNKDARLERERYGGIEPADINEWWAPLNRVLQALIWPLKGAREDLLTLLTVQVPGIMVKRPSGLIVIPAGGQWDSQNLAAMPHRVLRVEVINYDSTNPLTLKTTGGQGGIQAGRLYIDKLTTYSAELNCTPQTTFILENAAGAPVNAQLILSGF